MRQGGGSTGCTGTVRRQHCLGCALLPPHAPACRYIDAEVDLCQTNAILRHLARKHGLYGANAAEQARVDEVRLGGPRAGKCGLRREPCGAQRRLRCAAARWGPAPPVPSAARLISRPHAARHQIAAGHRGGSGSGGNAVPRLCAAHEGGPRGQGRLLCGACQRGVGGRLHRARLPRRLPLPPAQRQRLGLVCGERADGGGCAAGMHGGCTWHSTRTCHVSRTCRASAAEAAAQRCSVVVGWLPPSAAARPPLS